MALLGTPLDFDLNSIMNRSGRSITRYGVGLYENLKKVIDVDIVTVNPGFLGMNLSFFFGNMLKDFEKYDIVHNIEQKPLLARAKHIVTTVHTEKPYLSILDYRIKKIREISKRFSYDDTKSIKGVARELFLNTLSEITLKYADKIIAISSITKDTLIEIGFEKERIAIIQQGLDEKYISQPKKHEKRRSSKFKVGYIGTFRARKNVAFALDAFKYLNNNFEFELWGRKMWQYEELVTRASGLRNVKFMGPAPEEKIVEIYDSFDAFVFPTLYEGFGRPILEAQARGLPVILYKDGEVPKEIRKYCFEAESPEHMAQIIMDLKEKGYDKKLKEKATEYARSFTWKRATEETLKLYKTILE
ncbi:MAG: glycosyltransferase [Candidatus Micrarchaeia archaeon]